MVLQKDKKLKLTVIYILDGISFLSFDRRKKEK